MARIGIFDISLRGEGRSPTATMTAVEKLRFAHELAALGVDAIEAGFPAGRPEDEAAIRKICREIRGPTIAVVSGLEAVEIERAARALEGGERVRIKLSVDTSPRHLQGPFGMASSECGPRVAEAVARAAEHADDVELTLVDAFRTDPDLLLAVVSAAVAAGARTVTLGDASGHAVPDEVADKVRDLGVRVQGQTRYVIGVEARDDLGLAVASSLAAVGSGARQVTCAMHGVGDAAGVAALEEVVTALALRGDRIAGARTEVATERLQRASRLLSYLTGSAVGPNKAVVGRGAVPRGLERGGAAGEEPDLENRFAALGYTLAEEELGRIARAYAALAARKESVLDEDLLSILHHGVMEDVPERYRLASLDVACGGESSRARLTIDVDGAPALQADGTGDGPIAAAFDAMDRALDFRVMLLDLTVRSATPGGDALGEVSIHAKVDGHTFTGRGAHTDVVRASAEAFLHAVNKAAAARVLEEEHLAESPLWGV